MGASGTTTEDFGWRWLIILALAIIALVALERSFSILSRPAPSTTFAPALASRTPQNYGEALARADRGIHDAQQRVATASDWRAYETLARRYLDRAALTGAFDDYAAADAALADAFAVAAPDGGPHMTQAALDVALSRLEAAERQLDRAEGRAADRAEATAMRGDIAFYRGRYAEAEAAYAEADRLSPGTAGIRRAICDSRTGHPDRALAYYQQAQAASPTTRQEAAAIAMQQGILDLERGRWDGALRHFRDADRIFPGFWRVEQHIAEVTALKGNVAAAERLYRALVRRTGNPELMDALAERARERGDMRTAATWTARAGTIWKQRLARFPEAAYGPALHHCIAAAEWGCALNLARRNHAARPYGESTVLLAEALLRTGRSAEAAATIETALASPWRTARLYAVASEIHAAQGDKARAAAERHAALGLNPHVFTSAAPSASAT